MLFGARMLPSLNRSPAVLCGLSRMKKVPKARLHDGRGCWICGISVRSGALVLSDSPCAVSGHSARFSQGSTCGVGEKERMSRSRRREGSESDHMSDSSEGGRAWLRDLLYSH